jgi:uncharacterized protein (DUF1800 family)
MNKCMFANKAMKGAMLASITIASLSLSAQSLPDTTASAHWRVQSRLGYGPLPTANVVSGSAKAWAQTQLQAAHAASKQSPNIPAELDLFAAPLPDLFKQYQEEREARRLGREIQRFDATRERSAAPMEAAPAMTGEPFTREVVQGLNAWRLMACSNAQIEQPMLARMTEFWFNHFNVSIDKSQVRPFVGNYLLQAIRPHALGTFEDLLLATAQHPAMLYYLDQVQSTQRGLNENYARELMELHTLGVGGGYSQDDVRMLARILTGWTVDLAGGQPFLFRPRQHEEGAKILMGQTFAQAGQQQGIAAIKFLAKHPSTAKRIATRMATFFVADQPPQALVDQLAATFTRTGGDIRAVMQTLIESPAFWESRHTLFKTPMDYACSALAASGSTAQTISQPPSLLNIRQAAGFLSGSGQRLHAWQTPDGYKTDLATWLAPEALTRRADFSFGMASRIAEPTYLAEYYSSATRERIAKETAPQMRTGLLLAAPEFMRK